MRKTLRNGVGLLLSYQVNNVTSTPTRYPNGRIMTSPLLSYLETWKLFLKSVMILHKLTSSILKNLARFLLKKKKWRLMFHTKYFRWITWPFSDTHHNTPIFHCTHLPAAPRFSYSFNMNVVILDFSVCLCLMIFAWTFFELILSYSTTQ